MNSPLNLKAHECTVLLSGGLDSAACVNFYKDQGYKVSAIHFSYGQVAESNELDAACRVAAYYGIDLQCLQFRGGRSKDSGEVFGRNGMFILAGLMETAGLSTTIALGIHDGTNYYDCSRGFIDQMQKVVDGQCDGRVRITAPFLTWNKPDVWRYCIEKAVPFELTYSCEAGTVPPCGECRSCLDREALHAS
jgi:7-cyano-7-deazaguanine synthase